MVCRPASTLPLTSWNSARTDGPIPTNLRKQPSWTAPIAEISGPTSPNFRYPHRSLTNKQLSAQEDPQRDPLEQSKMLGARACRVLAGTDRAAPSRPTRPETPTLTPEQRHGRWKAMTIKLMLVVRNFFLKKITQEILGIPAYRTIFQQVDHMERPAAAEQVVHRVINGEIVGEILKSGKKVPTDEAMLCPHPLDQMKRRGNRDEKWWICFKPAFHNFVLHK